MATPGLKALVAIDDGISAELVERSMPVGGDIEVSSLVDGLDDAWLLLQETTADLVVVATAGYSERALVFIEGAVRERPTRPVIVLCQGSPNGFVRRVFEAGADDILHLPESTEVVLFALQKSLARKQGSAGTASAKLSPLVSVLGPKGGTGKTLTAANLGVALAEAGHKVAIVDLDLQFGDLGLSLGVTPERTIFDLAKSAGSIDGDKIEAYLIEHASGLRLLLAPSRPDQASAVTVEFLREVYSALRSTHDFVIVDTPPGFTPEVIVSIDASTDIVLVGMLDSLSLKNTKLGLETLQLMGYDLERVKIVLNRADSRVGISREDVVAVLGREPDVLVPSDREIPRALNQGMPLIMARKSSDAAAAFRRLAEAISSRLDANGAGAEKRGRRRLIGRRA